MDYAVWQTFSKFVVVYWKNRLKAITIYSSINSLNQFHLGVLKIFGVREKVVSHNFSPSSETQGQLIEARGKKISATNGFMKVYKDVRKSPWEPTLTRPFPNGSANAGS